MFKYNANSQVVWWVVGGWVTRCKFLFSLFPSNVTCRWIKTIWVNDFCAAALAYPFHNLLTRWEITLITLNHIWNNWIISLLPITNLLFGLAIKFIYISINWIWWQDREGSCCAPIDGWLELMKNSFELKRSFYY